MAKKKQTEKEISIRAYAAMLNVDEKTVRNARDAGFLGKGYNVSTGKIVPSLVDKSWGNKQKIIKPKAGVSRAKAIKKLEGAEIKNSKEKSAVNTLPKKLENMTAQELLSCIDVTIDMPQVQALRYREIIALALDKIKLQKEEGILVDKEKVHNALFKFGSMLKRSMMDIPSRIIDDLILAPNKVEAINILTAEINEVLRIFSNKETIESHVKIS